MLVMHSQAPTTLFLECVVKVEHLETDLMYSFYAWLRRFRQSCESGLSWDKATQSRFMSVLTIKSTNIGKKKQYYFFLIIEWNVMQCDFNSLWSQKYSLKQGSKGICFNPACVLRMYFEGRFVKSFLCTWIFCIIPWVLLFKWISIFNPDGYIYIKTKPDIRQPKE